MSSVARETVSLNTSQRIWIILWTTAGLMTLAVQLLLKAEAASAWPLVAGHCRKLAATEVTGSDEITDRPDLGADSPTKVSCNMTTAPNKEKRLRSLDNAHTQKSTASYTLQSKQRGGGVNMMGWVDPIVCLDAAVLRYTSCPYRESNLNSLIVQLTVRYRIKQYSPRSCVQLEPRGSRVHLNCAELPLTFGESPKFALNYMIQTSQDMRSYSLLYK
jgi:hypothetical protein